MWQDLYFTSATHNPDAGPTLLEYPVKLDLCFLGCSRELDGWCGVWE